MEGKLIRAANSGEHNVDILEVVMERSWQDVVSIALCLGTMLIITRWLITYWKD